MNSISAIVKKVGQTYSSCVSYRDSGSSKILFPNGNSDTVLSQVKFRTAIYKPNYFFFEAICENSNHKIFHSDASQSQDIFIKVLRNEIAVAFPSSNGTSALISTLVLDGLKDFLKMSILELSFNSLEECEIDGSPCFTLRTDQNECVVIRQSDHLICHVEHRASEKDRGMIVHNFNFAELNNESVLNSFLV